MPAPCPLGRLPLDTPAVIVSLAPDCQNRRRLMDLGFVAGASVRALFRSPADDPTAYQIGGIVVALRRADTSGILVCPTSSETRCPP